jgi:molecular chaperone DnaK
MAGSSKVIGIDLGTTNSVVAIMEGGSRSSSPTPRARASPLGRRLPGERRAHRRPRREAPGGHERQEHHLLDQALHGPAPQRGGDRREDGPYKIVGGADELVKVEVRGKQYTPPEISAMILTSLKERPRRTSARR